MAKINRYSGNVVPFANNAQAGELFDFGSESDQNTDLDSLVNASYLRGWGIVGASDFPPLEWFNAQAFTSGQFISYLHQMGVPEWNVDQEYPTEGAQVVHSGGVWTRGADWVIGDEPGVADSTRWAKSISAADLGTAAYATVGTGGTELPTNADVDSKLTDIESDITELSTANNDRTKAALNASGSAPIYACRAWVNFNGTGTVAIRASGNVSSITDNGTGDYTVNFITAIEDVNYSVSGLAGDDIQGNFGLQPLVMNTSNININTKSTFDSSKYDLTKVLLSIHR